MASILFITATGTITASGDVELRDLLVANSHSITVGDDNDTRTAATDEATYDLIYVSSSVSSTTMGAKVRDHAMPVIWGEDAITDEMGEPASMAVQSDADIKLVNTSEPHNVYQTDAGFTLNQNVVIYGSTESIRHTTAAPTYARTYFEDPDSSTNIVVLGFEIGDTTSYGTAAGLRVGLLYLRDNITGLTADGDTTVIASFDYGLQTGGTTYNVSGDVAGSGALSGDLVVKAPIDGDFAGSGSLAGDIESGISGDPSGSGALSGDLTGDFAVDGDLSGSGSLFGDLAAILLDGDVSGSGALSAGLNGELLIAGEFDGSTSLVGNLNPTDNEVLLNGDVFGFGTLTGDLSLPTGLSGALTGSGDVYGRVLPAPYTPITLPTQAVIDAINGSVTKVTRRVEFYEFDGVTPWEPEGAGVYAPLVDGSVTIDASRDERRMLQLRLHNQSGLYRVTKDGLWYDKVIKVYRGITYSGGSYEALLGTFYMDSVTEKRFPKFINITARDRTKLLRQAKFATETKFNNNDPVKNVLESIAIAGGIDAGDIDFPIDMGSLNEDTFFDTSDTRWKAMKDIANAFKWDLFFLPDGTLKAVEFADPATQAAEYNFTTGPTGNLADYSRKLTDDRIRNHIVVRGETSGGVPIYAEAENNDPTSPTRIDRIGRRTEVYEYSYIGSVFQAQDLADVFLSISSLEQYELDMESIVSPFIDVNTVVGFVDPDPIAGDPVDFLLQRATIPLGLGTMSLNAGRVTLAG